MIRSAGITSVGILHQQFPKIVERAPNRLHVAFNPALGEGDIQMLIRLVVTVEGGVATSSEELLASI